MRPSGVFLTKNTPEGHAEMRQVLLLPSNFPPTTRYVGRLPALAFPLPAPPQRC
jgi:hypothetical protein